MNDTQLPKPLIDRLLAASRVAVLTGAGVSAESGIPTFRDAQTGLWAKHDPMALASPEGFARDAALVWRWYQWRRELIAEARPNVGHEALAAMSPHFSSFTLITQNVDGLHTQAGSTGVLELHGNIGRTICSKTRKTIDAEWLQQHADTAPPPSPHDSDGLARPDVVWFGEMLDTERLEQAFSACAQCDLMLIVGTAGAVHPAASLPQEAKRAGAAMIEINPERSALTALADWHLPGPGGLWLPILAEVLDRHGAAKAAHRPV